LQLATILNTSVKRIPVVLLSFQYLFKAVLKRAASRSGSPHILFTESGFRLIVVARENTAWCGPAWGLASLSVSCEDVVRFKRVKKSRQEQLFKILLWLFSYSPNQRA